MKAAGQTLARPYAVGLVTTVVLGSITAAALFAVSRHEAKLVEQQAAAQRSVEELPLPAGLSEKVVVDCAQVSIDRCLYSAGTPPTTLGSVRSMLGRIAPTSTTPSCGGGTRPEATRCGFDTEVGGVPVRVMLWPHVGTNLQFQGTDVWIDVRTDTDGYN